MNTKSMDTKNRKRFDLPSFITIVTTASFAITAVIGYIIHNALGEYLTAKFWEIDAGTFDIIESLFVGLGTGAVFILSLVINSFILIKLFKKG